MFCDTSVFCVVYNDLKINFDQQIELLNCENVRAMIYYYFWRTLIQQQCADQPVSTFGNAVPHRATEFRWFAEFNRNRYSL